MGPPGALATQSATGPSPGGAMFGPPTPTYSAAHERRGEVGQPVRVGTSVVVDVGDDRAARGLQACIACGCSARDSRC